MVAVFALAAPGFANTEVVLAVSNYLIRINKGELYNGVIIGYALMNVFNALLSMLINLTGGYGSALVTLRARKLLWRKILHLPMREVERRQPSALISGLVNDITQASLVVQMAFNTIVSLYSFFRCCWEMYRFDGTLSLIHAPVAAHRGAGVRAGGPSAIPEDAPAVRTA